MAFLVPLGSNGKVRDFKVLPWESGRGYITGFWLEGIQSSLWEHLVGVLGGW